MCLNIVKQTEWVLMFVASHFEIVTVAARMFVPRARTLLPINLRCKRIH